MVCRQMNKFNPLAPNTWRHFFNVWFHRFRVFFSMGIAATHFQGSPHLSQRISLIFSLADNMRACNSYVSFLAKDCTWGPGLFAVFHCKIGIELNI